MWMQVLAAVGFPILGEAFPGAWRGRLDTLNPGGFFEGKLREGVHWQTNPDPATGTYLHPSDTRRHAVKIFPLGLVRSDLAFLDRVLVTYRPWRAQLRSRLHFVAVENASMTSRGLSPAPTHDLLVGEWFREVYLLFEDIERRRYPVHVESWPKVLERPEVMLPPILSWIGAAPGRRVEDTLERAIAVVGDPKSRTAAPVSPDLEAQVEAQIAAFEGIAGRDALSLLDALDAAVHEGRGLDESLLDAMNALIHTLLPALRVRDEVRSRWMDSRLDGAT